MTFEDVPLAAILPALLTAAVLVRTLGLAWMRRSALRSARDLGLRALKPPRPLDLLRGSPVEAQGTLHLGGRPRTVRLSLGPRRDGLRVWQLCVEASTAAPLCVVSSDHPANAAETAETPLLPGVRTTRQDVALLETYAETYAAALAVLPATADAIHLGRGSVCLTQRVGAKDPHGPHTVARLAHAAWLLDAVDGAPSAPELRP